jgi:hypothetical protein
MGNPQNCDHFWNCAKFPAFRFWSQIPETIAAKTYLPRRDQTMKSTISRHASRMKTDF